jgi:hypothetical protein
MYYLDILWVCVALLIAIFIYFIHLKNTAECGCPCWMMGPAIMAFYVVFGSLLFAGVCYTIDCTNA